MSSQDYLQVAVSQQDWSEVSGVFTGGVLGSNAGFEVFMFSDPLHYTVSLGQSD